MEAKFEKLRSYIKDDLVSGDVEVDDDTSLFSTRIIHSRNLMSLIQFMETEFGIKVGPMDLSFENFDSIGLMIKFIQSKL